MTTHLPQRSSADNYDALSKINNQNLPPTNDAIDWDNPSLASGICDVAALTQTAPLFWCRITLAATTGALILLSWQAMWGNVTTTAPILARSSTGVFTITLPLTVSDEYDASFGVVDNIAVNLSGATGNLEGTVFGFVNCSASGNVITINTANTAGSPNDLVGSNLLIVSR